MHKAAIVAAGLVLLSGARPAPGAGKPAGPGTPSTKPASASTSPAPGSRAAETRDVVVLSNGLRVLFLESRSNPMVASTVAVLSGVRDETPATNGASHFLEHMLFDGTISRSQEQIQRDVEFIGGYNNATTRDEVTLFMMLVHRDKLAPALDIQFDMLFHSTIPADAFERERKVVLEELARDSSDPGYGPEQFFKSRYYAGTARAMPVLGSAASVGKVTRDAVYAHYVEHYRPERMVLFLAGDFDRSAVRPLLEKTFGAARAAGGSSDTGKGTAGSARAASRPDTPIGPPAPVRGSGRPGLYREHIDGERGYLKIGIPAPGIGDPDAAAFTAIAGLLGGGPGSRLAGALMGATSQTGAIEAGTEYVPGAGEGRLEIQATLQSGSNGFGAIAAIRRELQRFADEPVSSEDLRAFVTAAGSESVYLHDQVHYLGMSVGPDLILGARPSLGVGQAELGALTPESLQSVAARWLASTGAGARAGTGGGSPAAATPVSSGAGKRAGAATAASGKRAADAARPTMVVTLSSPSVPSIADPEGADPVPDAAPRPSASSAEAVAAAPLAPPTDSAPDGTDGAKTGAPGAAGPAARMNVRRVVLENGLTVIVGENSDSKVFAAHVLVRDRAAMEPAEMTGIADVLHRLLPYGSLYLDGEGLTQKLQTLGARMKTVDDASISFDDYYNSPRYSYVRFETIHENWREGLGYLFTTIAYPRLDDTDIALAIAEEINIARKRAETPAIVARDLYAKTILKDCPLARPVTGTPISLATIKPDDLRAFHDRYFSPERMVLSIVSDVPASDVLAVLSATFGRMKPYKARPSDRDTPAAAAPGAARVTPPRTAAAAPEAAGGAPPLTTAEKRAEQQTGRAQSQVLMGRIFEREDDDFPALVVATTVLSQAIGRDLRDARGLAYAAGCSLEDYGDRSWFTVSIGTKPENVAEAESAIHETIRAFPGKELEESVVERAVNAMRGSGAMRRMTRISQAYSLGFNELLGRPVGFDAALDARLADVKAADVKRVVAKYLDSDRMVTAVAR